MDMLFVKRQMFRSSVGFQSVLGPNMREVEINLIFVPRSSVEARFYILYNATHCLLSAPHLRCATLDSCNKHVV